jgi:hypothetical protein
MTSLFRLAALASLLLAGCIKDISTGLDTGLNRGLGSASVGGYIGGSLHVAGDDATLADSFPVPYRSTIDIIDAPGGGVLVLRDAEPDLFLLSRLDATLDTLWSARLVRNTERKERLLMMMVSGGKVIVLSSFQPAWNSDTLHLVARSYGLAGGMPDGVRIIGGVAGGDLGEGVRDYSLLLSPNRSRIAACVIHPPDTATGRQIIDTRVISSDLTPIQSRRITIMNSGGETKNRAPLPGTMAVDDEGNLHIVRFPDRGTMEALRYSATGSPDGRMSLTGVDFRSGDSVIGGVEAGARIGSDGMLHVEGSRMRYDALRGMFAARFDFRTGRAEMLFDSPITEEINNWMAQGVGNLEIELRRVIPPDSAGRYLYIFENASRHSDPMAIRFGIDIAQLGTTAHRIADSTPMLYRYRDIYIFAFDATGRPLWRNIIRKSYEEGGFTNAHLDIPLRAIPARDHLDLFYISRKNTGLVRTNVPLDGSPVPPLSLLLWLGRGAHLPLDRAAQFSDSAIIALTVTREGPQSAVLRKIILPAR